MNGNDIPFNIHASRGTGVILLGFRLQKKPDKTAEETLAASAFLKTFWGAIGLTLLYVVMLAVLTGYAMAGPSAGYDGEYAESRTGRVENGKIRYVKNTLFYISPEEIGLLEDDLPEGTHITLYFDENGNIIAGENADTINAATESRVIWVITAMGLMAVSLLVFAIAAKKTFGKPWFQWLHNIQNG